MDDAARAIKSSPMPALAVAAHPAQTNIDSGTSNALNSSATWRTSVEASSKVTSTAPSGNDPPSRAATNCDSEIGL